YQDELEQLPGIGVGNVTVTGNQGGPYTITFLGLLANKNVPSLVPVTTGSGANVVMAVSETIPGGGIPANLTFIPNVSPSSALLKKHLETIPALLGNIEVQGDDGGPFDVIFTNGLAAQNVGTIVSSVIGSEVQRITFTGTINGGSYRLAY